MSEEAGKCKNNNGRDGSKCERGEWEDEEGREGE